MWFILHNKRNIYYLIIIILVTKPVNVISRITQIQNYTDFTNLVFQPRSNSPTLPPDTLGMELITKNGYPLEIHQIVTKDQYILTAFRIPCGRNSVCKENTTNPKPPVFVLHGLLQSSDVWVHNSQVDNCLGFVLADAGYDVWLGNQRGSVYSSEHVFLKNTEPGYSNYSMDELGKYDMPSTIKYILHKTGKPKLHFIGYSLGATFFYMAMTKFPELNDKIALHISLAPAIFFDNERPLVKFVASFSDILQLFQGGVTFPRDYLLNLSRNILPLICHPNVDTMGICRFILFFIFGASPNHITREQLPFMLGQGGSLLTLKMLIHMLQLVKSGEFSEYDYGAVGNIREYGQSNVPHYNLQDVTAPVAIIQAPSDIYAPTESTNRLASRLKNLVEYHMIPNNEFSHSDFSFSNNANILVYSPILKLLNRFS